MSKVAPDQIVRIRSFLFAGDKSFPPSLSQKLGACGLNPKKTMEDIGKAMEPWRGCRVYVEIIAQNRVAQISVKPGTSAQVIKEMGEMRPRDRKKEKLPNRSGNITMDKVVKIAKLMQEEGKSQSRSFAGSVKQILGTCLSVGCTIDGRSPKDVTREINDGTITL